MKYEQQKKAWDWLNSTGADLIDDGLLDVESADVENLGDLADLMLGYSDYVNNSLQSQLQAKDKELEELKRNLETRGFVIDSLSKQLNKHLTPPQTKEKND